MAGQGVRFAAPFAAPRDVTRNRLLQLAIVDEWSFFGVAHHVE